MRIALGILGAVLVLSAVMWDLNQSPTLVNVTTDIHAGKARERDYTRYTPGNIVYPAQGPEAFQKFLTEPGDVFIALGDQSNTCRDAEEYDNILADIVRASGKTVYFGFGNHDCDPYFSQFLAAEKYYFRDFGRWRLIVLNSEEEHYNPGGQDYGGMSAPQLEWLVTALDTQRDVVLAISKPAFDKDLVTPKENWKRFFEIVRSHRNVKHVLGGDYHVFHETREVDGVQYHFVQALTLDSHQGRFLQLRLDNSWARLWMDRLSRASSVSE